MAQFHNAEITDLHPPPSPKMGASVRGGTICGARMFASGELRLILLHLIHIGVRHGYGMIKAIADLTGEVYSPSPGAVYPTLILMLDEAVIKQHVTEAQGDEGKKSFIASKEGEAELDVRGEEVAALLARLAVMADAQASGSSPIIAAAMGRLDGALNARAACGGLESEKVAEIAIWIDDLAGKIKRP